MITINSYNIAERAIYEGVALAVEKMGTDKELAKSPEKIVDFIAGAVMAELTGVIDFGTQPVKFSPALEKHMWDIAKAQAKEEIEQKESN